MTEEELKKLISVGEGERLDFKESITSREKIAKTMVAFANTKGGRLLIGVKDNGRIRGVDVMEEMEMLRWAADVHTFPVLNIHFQSVLVEKKPVLIADIAESDAKPVFAIDAEGKKWAYIRSYDQTLKASKVMLEVMKMDAKNIHNKLEMSWVEQKILDYLQKERKITLNQFCELCNISKRRAHKTLVALLRMNLIKVFNHEKEEFYTL